VWQWDYILWNVEQREVQGNRVFYAMVPDMEKTYAVYHYFSLMGKWFPVFLLLVGKLDMDGER
jgi:hypothetical protein